MHKNPKICKLRSQGYLYKYILFYFRSKRKRSNDGTPVHMQPTNKKSKRTTSDPITMTDEDIKDMLDMSEQETYNPTPIDANAGAKPYDPEDDDEFYDPEIATFDEKPTPPPTKKGGSRGDPAFSSDGSSPSPPPPKSKFGRLVQNFF